MTHEEQKIDPSLPSDHFARPRMCFAYICPGQPRIAMYARHSRADHCAMVGEERKLYDQVTAKVRTAAEAALPRTLPSSPEEHGRGVLRLYDANGNEFLRETLPSEAEAFSAELRRLWRFEDERWWYATITESPMV